MKSSVWNPLVMLLSSVLLWHKAVQSTNELFKANI